MKNYLLVFAYLTFLSINLINSGKVSPSLKTAKGELTCELETQVTNVSYADIYIHPRYLADR